MRLTKKDIEYQLSHINCCYGARLVGKKFFGLMCKEMLEYKDIEDELGIDLITLFKALKNGIYLGGTDDFDIPLEIEHWKPKSFDIKYHKYMGWCFSKVCGGQTYNNKDEDNFGFVLNYSAVKFKDYGKTWALTKEELQ